MRPARRLAAGLVAAALAGCGGEGSQALEVAAAPGRESAGAAPPAECPPRAIDAALPDRPAAAPPDAGAIDGRAPDAVPPARDASLPDGLAPLFAAAGYGGRRVVSRDLGLTWVD